MHFHSYIFKPSSDQAEICIVGLGKVGFALAQELILSGNSISIKEKKPISEFRLQENNDLIFVSNCQNKLPPQVVMTFLLCVDTIKNGAPSTDSIFDSVREISGFLQSGSSIIIVSTCPVGTLERVGSYISEIRPDLISIKNGLIESKIFIATSPERSAPDFMSDERKNMPRNVGGINHESAVHAANFLKQKLNYEICIFPPKVCELTKLIENSYRDTLIALSTEVASLALNYGVDPLDVISSANKHMRVNLLEPRVGVGGHCLPFATHMLEISNPEKSLFFKARKINEDWKKFAARKILTLIETEKTKPIGFLGLGFKPDADCSLFSSAIDILKMIEAHIPEGLIADDGLFSDVNIKGYRTVSETELIHICDFVFILTEHKRYESIAFQLEKDGFLLLENTYPLSVWQRA